MKTRVYQYGLLRPRANAEGVWEQLRAAHNYRNALTEIERERRSELRSVMSSYADVAVLEEQLRAATERRNLASQAVKYARSCTRTRSESAAARAELQLARGAVKEARAQLGARRATKFADDQVRLQCDEVNAGAAAQKLAARDRTSCFWGTYLLVEAAMDASSKQPLYDGHEPNDPRFVRWRAEGTIGVQVQKGMAAGDIFGEDRRVQIDPVNELAWHSPTRGVRRKMSRTTLRLRVGSTEKGQPVWAEWPMLMHRPLPPEGQIMRVNVTVRRYAGHDRWATEITVRLPDHWRQGVCGSGMVAVDIGWRVIGTELRVAYWRGDDGQHGELRLSEKTLNSLSKASSLRAIRDRVLDQFKSLMGLWLTEVRADPSVTVPDWFEAAVQTLPWWRSTERLGKLAHHWAKERWPGDSFGFELIEAWRKRNQHLWDWEANQRRGALAHRRELFRLFAADLTSRYGTVVLEDFNMKRVARRPATGLEADDNQQARSNRQCAAVSELRNVLRNSFSRRGGCEIEVPAPGTTIVCSACERLDKFDAAAELVHTCRHCGATWDQDDNATINMLRLGHEHRSGAHRPATARNRGKETKNGQQAETKWQRVARLRQEKLARQQTARNTDCNAT